MSSDLSVAIFNAAQQKIEVTDTNGNSLVDAGDVAVAKQRFDSYREGKKVPFDNATYQSLRNLTSSIHQGDAHRIIAQRYGLVLENPVQTIKSPGEAYAVYRNGSLLGHIAASNYRFSTVELLQQLQRFSSELYPATCQLLNIASSPAIEEKLAAFNWEIKDVSLYHNGRHFANLDGGNQPNYSVTLDLIPGQESKIKITCVECDGNTISYELDLVTSDFTQI